MFGKRKDITQKFIERTGEELPEYNISYSKKVKNINKSITDDDNNFIFYGSNNKFSKQLEIYATLKDKNENNDNINAKNTKLVVVIIDSDYPMKFLSYKICEAFAQFPEYRELQGLQATNFV